MRADIVVTVGEALALPPIPLELGGVQEAVTVTSSVSRVNTQTSELSYLVSEQAIATLPLNGRNYTDLALLQPGVLAYPSRDGGSVVAHGLGMSVNGQDYRSNVYLLDGTLQNDFTNGPAGSAAGTTLGMESIQEFRVESNAYSAEFGRNFGGQINVLTKSGTNTLRGSAYEFHRNDALDAANYFDVAGKPDFTRNQFGGAVGGPLAKDRLFYFVGYEGLRENLGQDDLELRAGRQRAARHAARRTGDDQRTRSGRIWTRSRAPTARRSGAGWRRTPSISIRRSIRISCRPPGLSAGHGAPVLRALHLRRRAAAAADRLPAVPALVHLHESVLHRRVPQRVLVADAADGALRLQPDARSARTSRRT